MAAKEYALPDGRKLRLARRALACPLFADHLRSSGFYDCFRDFILAAQGPGAPGDAARRMLREAWAEAIALGVPCVLTKTSSSIEPSDLSPSKFYFRPTLENRVPPPPGWESAFFAAGIIKARSGDALKFVLLAGRRGGRAEVFAFRLCGHNARFVCADGGAIVYAEERAPHWDVALVVADAATLARRESRRVWHGLSEDLLFWPSAARPGIVFVLVPGGCRPSGEPNVPVVYLFDLSRPEPVRPLPAVDAYASFPLAIAAGITHTAIADASDGTFFALGRLNDASPDANPGRNPAALYARAPGSGICEPEFAARAEEPLSPADSAADPRGSCLWVFAPDFALLGMVRLHTVFDMWELDYKLLDEGRQALSADAPADAPADAVGGLCLAFQESDQSTRSLQYRRGVEISLSRS